jgi:hypothetical protein
MKSRTGRPPSQPKAGAKYSTITIRIPAEIKSHLIDVADGYGMTLTEYLLTLIDRDAPQAPPRIES